MVLGCLYHFYIFLITKVLLEHVNFQDYLRKVYHSRHLIFTHENLAPECLIFTPSIYDSIPEAIRN